jgi:hypothetical protein
MEKELLEQLINKNLSIVDIAEQAGVTVAKVRYYLKKNSLKTLNLSRKNGEIPTYEELSDCKCIKCGLIKPISDFYKTRKPSGKYYPYSYCKQCAVDRIKSNNVEPFKASAVKYKGGKCVSCGYNRCLKALEFHHLDRSVKDFSISSTSSWGKYSAVSEELMKKELDKCVLLCANCHREVHDGMLTLQI